MNILVFGPSNPIIWVLGPSEFRVWGVGVSEVYGFRGSGLGFRVKGFIEG